MRWVRAWPSTVVRGKFGYACDRYGGRYRVGLVHERPEVNNPIEGVLRGEYCIGP